MNLEQMVEALTNPPLKPTPTPEPNPMDNPLIKLIAGMVPKQDKPADHGNVGEEV